jgi:hypothetical protein
MCGDPLEAIALVVLNETKVLSDTGLHPRCLHLAVVVCPHLAAPGAGSAVGRGDPQRTARRRAASAAGSSRGHRILREPVESGLDTAQSRRGTSFLACPIPSEMLPAYLTLIPAPTSTGTTFDETRQPR